MKNVLIFLSSEGNAMRECIIGVLNYANAGSDWKLTLGNNANELTPERIRKARADGVSGIITGVTRQTPGFRALLESGIPTVLNNYPPDWTFNPRLPITCIHNDDLAIGRLGAKYLTGKAKFRSYAFVPDYQKCFWSTYRQRGFNLELGVSKIRPTSFRRQRETLDEWLIRLPKPAAIMAVNDHSATEIITACRRLRIEIPSQVSIIGVDNDACYCNSLNPTLSSVHPNHVEMGRRAAAELDRLMRTHQSRGEIYIAPIGIVERRSSCATPPTGHLIDQSLAFIQKHYQEGIWASDVAKHLGVSEQLLRLRFNTILGRSVRDTILETRLRAAKKLLERKKDSVTRIAEKTGFSSACRFTHFFREQTGQSPSDWCANQTTHP